MAKIAVIGAGPSGCIAAYLLKQQNHDITLYDAASQVGGRTFTYRKGGYHLDTGAGFFTNFYPTLLHLLKKLNIKSEITPLDRTTSLIYQGKIGHLKLGSIRSYTQYPFLNVKDKLKMAAHAAHLTAKRHRFNLTDLNRLKYEDNESVAQFVRKELGEDIYQFIVRPGIEPFWYFSCEAVSKSLYLALTSQALDAKFYTLKSGMDTLCRTITSSQNLLLNHEVIAITHDSTSDQFRVSASEKDKTGESIRSNSFDKIIIATTAGSAFKITKNLTSKFVSDLQRRFLKSQQYVANIHTSYLVKQFARKQLGTSLFPCGPGDHDVSAIGFNSLKSANIRRSNNELISLYMSAKKSEALINASENEIHQKCYNIACKTYKELPQKHIPFHQVVRSEAIPIPEVGRYQQAYQFQQSQRGPIVFAGDYLSTPTVEGALVSGKAAVRSLYKENRGVALT